MADLVPSRLPLADIAAEQTECLQEERFDEVGLEPPRFEALHVFPNLLDLGCIHAVVRQRPLFKKLLAVLAVGQVVDYLMQACLDFGLVTVADGFDEQIAEPLFAEQLAQNVEDAPAKSLPLLLAIKCPL